MMTTASKISVTAYPGNEMRLLNIDISRRSHNSDRSIAIIDIDHCIGIGCGLAQDIELQGSGAKTGNRGKIYITWHGECVGSFTWKNKG